MTEIIQTIYNFFSSMGYVGIFVMMTIESSFIPFPSEIVMIPAGALAHKGDMNFALALASGTAGAWLWATINYFLGLYLGAPILKKLIQKYGKFVFLKMEIYEKSEKYFREKGSQATFFGRFIPGIRQIISFPAGIVRMNFTKFSLFTILGAGLWNLFLMIIGYFFDNQKDLILHNAKYIILAIFGFVMLYFAFKFFRQKSKK